MFEKILKNVKDKTPLVHHITNYVTVNDCANMTLACGGSPIMADDINEAADITTICQSLVINIGTLNERTIQSMLAAAKKANKLGHPVILDPVGAGASPLRTTTVFKLLETIKFSVIRGNISEIKTVYAGSGATKGVDAAAGDAITEKTLDESIRFMQELSQKTQAVVVITGATDLVADARGAYIIRNGHAMMSQITGSGCMLTSVIGAYCGANPENILNSTAAAVSAMGLCGELAYEKILQTAGGNASFRTHLIDAMSGMDWPTLKGGMKIEVR